MKLNYGFDGLLYGETFCGFLRNKKKSPHNRSDSARILLGFEDGNIRPDKSTETKAGVQSGVTKVVSWTSVEMFTSRKKRLMA